MPLEGVKSHLPSRDIVVERMRSASDGTTFWHKYLLLGDSLVLGLHAVPPEPNLRGFGLWVRALPSNPDERRSWNWFERKGAVRFTSYRGPDRFPYSSCAASAVMILPLSRS